MNQGQAKSRCGGGWLAAAVAIAALLVPVSSAGAVGRDFFGVVPAEMPEQEEFQTMGDGQVGTYRFQLSWANVQPTEDGAFDWSASDSVIGNAAANGIEVLPFAYGTPSYAGATKRTPPIGSPEHKQGWKDFLIAAAERYGPAGEYWTDPLLFALEHPGAAPHPIRAWQILNEQNSPTFYEPKPSVKGYAKLLEISDEALSSVDSGARIVLGGMFGTPSPKKAIYAWKYLKRLYKVKGAKRHFDAIALHPYSPNLNGIEAQIELAREKVKKAGGGRPPIWITEIGWGSAGIKGHALVKSPAGQKRMLRKSFRLLSKKRRGKWKIRRLLWFAWSDPASPDDSSGTATCVWCASAGLFDHDLAEKPSWAQFLKFTGGV
jgi:hypothetical protein